MANVLVNESSLEDIADAIRSKNGTSTKYKPAEMADAISAISGGGITPTGTKTISITQNGTVTEDVTNYANAQVNANVPNSYSASDEGKVVDNGALVSQTSTNITTNGTVDTTTNNEVVVSVPNSYSASDEGKVVSNGALVSQTSDTVTTNDTYDTTLINSLTVNVSGGGGTTSKFTGIVELLGVSTTSISIPISGYTLTGNEKFYATLKLVGTGTYSGGSVTWDNEIQVPSDVSNNNRIVVSGSYSNRILGISKINDSSGTEVSGNKAASNSVYAINATSSGGSGTINGTACSIDTANNAINLQANTNYKYCNTTWGTKYEYEVYLLTSSGTLA